MILGIDRESPRGAADHRLPLVPADPDPFLDEDPVADRLAHEGAAIRPDLPPQRGGGLGQVREGAQELRAARLRAELDPGGPAVRHAEELPDDRVPQLHAHRRLLEGKGRACGVALHGDQVLYGTGGLGVRHGILLIN